jgi:excisionase family DNA binding protein
MAKRKVKEKRMPISTGIHAQTTVESPLLTVKETAKYLRISETLLWQMLRKKKLTPLRLGDRVLFSRTYLQRFCEGGE